MKVMVLVKANEESEAGVMPSEKVLAAMGQYNEALVNAGVMQAGEGLHPSSKGKRVCFSDGQKTVIDGPFTETKELIAGFWIWKVKNMDEAVEWVKRMPSDPNVPEEEIEIRQVLDADEFAPSDPSGELQARGERLRAQAAGAKA